MDLIRSQALESSGVTTHQVAAQAVVPARRLIHPQATRAIQVALVILAAHQAIEHENLRVKRSAGIH